MYNIQVWFNEEGPSNSYKDWTFLSSKVQKEQPIIITKKDIGDGDIPNEQKLVWEKIVHSYLSSKNVQASIKDAFQGLSEGELAALKILVNSF